MTLSCLANVVLEQGDILRAEDLLRESMSLALDIDDRWFVGDRLASLAITAERQRQPRRAARLIGTVDAMCDRVLAPLMLIPAQIARYEHTIEVVRAQLGEEAFVAARVAGRSLSQTEAINEAMIETTNADDEPRYPFNPAGRLLPRE